MSELGLHKSGTNTNDATATENDILNGKTAYIKGIKKTGNISTIGSTPGTVYNTDGNGNFGILVPYTGYYQQNTILYANASAAGITPEKILQGQSILGVAGTAVKEGAYAYAVRQFSPYVTSTSQQPGLSGNEQLADDISINPLNGMITGINVNTYAVTNQNYMQFCGKYRIDGSTYYVRLSDTPQWYGDYAAFTGSTGYGVKKTVVKVVCTDTPTYLSETTVGNTLCKDVE